MQNPIDLDLALSISRKFFEELQTEQMTPLMYSFPKNSCELASSLLASALSAKYKDSVVWRIKGTNEANTEMHFWVQIEESVLDSTAHQFEEYASPFVCRAPSPLQNRFSQLEKVNAAEAIEALQVPNKSTMNKLIEELLRRLPN